MPIKHISIFGDTPLVMEYASLCLHEKIHVSLRANPSGAQQAGKKLPQIPRGAKRVPKPVKNVGLALELSNLSLDEKRKNLIELDKVLPSKVSIISSSVTVSVTEQSGWISKPERLIGIGALPTLLQGSLIELALSFKTSEATLQAARDFAGAIGKDAAVVQDSVGMVLPRILCALANEAYFAMMEGVAAGGDIDTAMKLGTNYPHGPVEWAERIGIRQVFAVVAALHMSFGEDRYRPAPSLHVATLRDGLPAR